MERLLARLERRFGRYAPPGFTWYLVIAQAVVFVLALTNPGVLELLTLDRNAVLHGQVWRLVTYLAIPPSLSPIWVIFDLYWLYLMGVSLEAHWGAFRYQVFWLLGMLGTTVLAFCLGIPASNQYLLLAVGLAFATLFPDYEILVFFVLPVKVKWLGLLDAVMFLAALAELDGFQKLLPLVAVGNYLLFFTPTLIERVRNRGRLARRSSGFAQAQRKADADARRPNERRCTVCGVTDADPAVEFRVCTCEKCGGRATEFCLAHARNH